MNKIEYPMYVYHGTAIKKEEVLKVIKMFERKSVNKNFFAGEKDFGPGFYTTTDRSQAAIWAFDKANKRPYLDLVPVVLKFALNQKDIDFNQTNQHIFLGPSEKWAKSIGYHRSTELGISCGCNPAHPDLVFGPMAIIKDIVDEAYKFREDPKDVKLFLNKITLDSNPKKDPKVYNPFTEKTQSVPSMGNQITFCNEVIGNKMLKLEQYARYYDFRGWSVYETK